MNREDLSALVEKQRRYFDTGATLNVQFRQNVLKRLRYYIKKYENEIENALCEDLGKSGFESYMCEIGMALDELSYMEKHLASFAREKTVPTPLSQFCSHSYEKPSPYGVVLIMSPWNYPFLLTIDPLIDAIAAGNTVVIKPAAYSARTGEILAKLVSECFPDHYVSVVTGGRSENAALLETHFDYIFFTGSKTVGKEVMRKASEYLTPVTLELGGKSPCIVEKSADIKLAAKRIVFGKFLNCGQTCVAPDYIYCDPSIKDSLVREIKVQIRRQFGKDPLENKNYGKIINEKHFERIRALIDPDKVVFGGRTDPDTLKIEPTVMDNVTFDDPVMQEEIFGPLLPVITYGSIDEAVEKINSMEHPLALYLFTGSRDIKNKVMGSARFGGGCVNDVVIHLATSRLGFGGFGESGMGSYHGKKGFDTFSHYKSIVDKKTWIDLPIRYQPYRKVYEKIVHMFMK